MRYSLCLCTALVTLVGSSAAFAQNVDISVLEGMRAELAALKTQQMETAARISALEGNLQMLAPSVQHNEPVEVLPQRAMKAVPVSATAAPVSSKFNAYADFMMRYEGNFGDPAGRDRERGVMRARLGADYQASDRLLLGGLLETGDPNDPNSGYVTISNFTDDLQVSLSRAFAKYSAGAFTFTGGKFAKPFTSMDLLWDGDVNPMGLAASWKYGSKNFDLNATGLFSIVDESAGGPDSTMMGGQLKLESVSSGENSAWAAISYYGYDLGSVSGADAGDIRSNLLRPDGHYLSDYDIIDVLAGFTLNGGDSQWPISVKADYVKNLGAAVSADTAYQVQLVAGKTKVAGDMAFHLGYGQAEVDSVLAAFSNDNFGLATNYKAYRLGMDYAWLDHVKLNASYYRYTSLDSLYATSILPGDWRDRIRLNVSVNY